MIVAIGASRAIVSLVDATLESKAGFLVASPWSRSMARGVKGIVNGLKPDAHEAVEVPSEERRIVTPNPELVVVKVGANQQRTNYQVPASEGAASLLSKLAKAIAKPGIDRSVVFGNSAGKRVYAYSVSSQDPTEFVREDASGRRTSGRFVNGRFRPRRSSKAKVV